MVHDKIKKPGLLLRLFGVGFVGVLMAAAIAGLFSHQAQAASNVTLGDNVVISSATFADDGNTIVLVASNSGQDGSVSFTWDSQTSDYVNQCASGSACDAIFLAPQAIKAGETIYIKDGANQTSKNLPNATIYYYTTNKQSAVSISSLTISGGASTGTGSAGNTTWYDTNGNSLATPTDSSNNPFEFITPTIIYDTSTQEYYSSDGGNGTYIQGGSAFLNDGVNVYWPVGTDLNGANAVNTTPSTANVTNPAENGLNTETYCAGGLAVSTSYEGSSAAANVYLVPTFDIAGNCEFGPPDDANPVASTPATHYGQGGDSMPPGANNGGLTDSANLFGANAFTTQTGEMLNSSLMWVTGSAPPSMDNQDGNVPLSLVGSVATGATTTPFANAANILANVEKDTADLKTIQQGDVSGSDIEVYTTQACLTGQGGDSDFPTVLVVDHDGSNTSLSDLDLSSQNAVGYILVNGATNGGAEGYSGATSWYHETAEINCLYGGNAPQNSGSLQNGDGNNGGTPGNIAHVYMNNLAASVGNPGTNPPATTTTPTAGSCAGSDETTENCQSQIVQCSATFNNPISWFVCPIVSSIQDIMNSVGSTINSYLTIPSQYFTTNTNSPVGQHLYVAWSNIRDLALSFLGLAALIMVFSQAISVGPFDAYTVKKVLPRIIVAAIFISLSWPLIGLAVSVSNGIGEGVRSLIYAPFQSLPDVNFTGVGAGGTALLTGLGVGGALGLVGVLALGISAALSLLTGLVVIVIRQIIVILLAILAPLALVFYILPGTDKAWRIWWDSFWGALIMFPLIEALIAVGSVFSKIAVGAGSSGLLDTIIAYIAIYLPYFLLPMTVRFAGGALRTIGGQVHSGHLSLQGGLSNFRSTRRQQNLQGMKTGERWHGQSWIPGSETVARGAGRITKGIGMGWNGHFGLPTKRSEQALDQRTRTLVAERVQSGEWAAIRDDDNALRAKTFVSAREAEQGLRTEFGVTDATEIERAINAARASGGFSANEQAAAAMTLVNTGTGYKSFDKIDPVTGEQREVSGLEELTRTIARVSHGNESTSASLSGYANATTKRVGRHDLSPGFSKLAELARREGGNGSPVTPEIYQDMVNNTWNSATTHDMVTDKPETLQQFANHWLNLLENGNQDQRRDAAVALFEMQNALPQASAENKTTINRTMNRLRDDLGRRIGIEFDSGTPVERQLEAIATHSTPRPDGTVIPGAVDLEGHKLTGETIRGLARVYDSNYPRDAMGMIPPTPEDPAAGGAPPGPGH